MKKFYLSFAVLLGLALTAHRYHHGGALAEQDSFAYLPVVRRLPENGLFVDPRSRDAVQAFYNTVYLASEGATPGWTGNVANCSAGATTQSFHDAVQLRINYFRAMAGVPAMISLNETYNQKAQEAALMMSANERLSHSPDPDWACYTIAGDEAAGSSNLFLGVYGPAAISGYIADGGASNYFVGHRRWLLYPQTQEMGTGDIPPDGGHWPANALWVFDDHSWDPRPATREPFVAWPPPGYVPYQVVFPRWSLSFPRADFSAASVSMWEGNRLVTVALQPIANGFGENTVVWEPDISLAKSPGDTVYQVEVANVLVEGAPQKFSYTVTVFDPAVPSHRETGRGILGVPPTMP